MIKNIQAFLIFASLLFARYLYLGWRRARIARASGRFGYTYVGGVTLDFLGPLDTPPWTAFASGLHGGAGEAIVVERPGGDIFSGVFGAGLLSEYVMGEKSRSFPYAIVGLRLSAGAPRARIAAYVAELELHNGLYVVMRGNCVYSLFMPGNFRRIHMHWRQRIALMRAMDYLSAGRLSEANELFQSQSGLSHWAVFSALLALAAFVGYLQMLFRNPDPVFMIVGLAVFLLVVMVFAYVVSDGELLGDYLERRSD